MLKKLIIYWTILILICFSLPIIFTKSFQTIETGKKEEEGNNNITQSQYDYKSYNTIKLLHTKDSSIEEIKLDEYLYGVVSAEMPANFEEEALKAQACVARTYTIYKITTGGGKHEGASICDSANCCQAWITKEDRLAKWEENVREENWKKIVNAVDFTQGKIITYEHKPINAFFHSNSGGTTEIPLNVWGGSGYPYLQAVQTSGEEAYTQYFSELTISQNEFIEKIRKEHPEFTIDFANADCIQILEYTDGNRVKKIKVGNLELSGVEIRQTLGLRSANFTVKIDAEQIKFEVKGYGHGVGMSQTGADSLAKQGKNYEEIIKHFYTGVEIEEI